MKAIDRPTHALPNEQLFGSDHIAELLRRLGFEHIALTPGASFRGLHDSLVNHLGNVRPEMLLCLHEESAVAIAHGFARVTGRPMPVALHSNVGLMHATMAIFNAWCDRVPMLLIGAQGPMDAVKRRPWVDWMHTSADMAALVRGYTKWDDQPHSLPAALESILRAYKITTTLPSAPVYVCLDAALQEEKSDSVVEMPRLDRFQAPAPADPAAEDLARAAEALAKAKRPIILIGRVSNDLDDWNRRVQLAERLNATVVTDIKTGASFPTTHKLHPHPPGLFPGVEVCRMIAEADVILGLDWIDFGGTIRQACGGRWPEATIIQCSLDENIHRGWSMDYQALPAADIAIPAAPDRLVRRLLDVVRPRKRPLAVLAPAVPAPAAAQPEPAAGTGTAPPPGTISVHAFARTIVTSLAGENPSYIRLPLGWPGEFCRFEHPHDYIGFDGGGGIGSGPGMAVGAALALRGGPRLPVAVLGDGDFLMGVTAVWTAVHYRIPVLIVIGNNQSFFNDELHQERVARMRQRPVENRWIGLRMSDPAIDLAKLAEGQGAVGMGPIATEADLQSALASAAAQVRAGAVCVLDVRVAPEYARATSHALLRHIPKAE